MGTRSEPVQVSRWPGGWCLVGNGPSYLLFCPKNKEVTHLASGLHRALRQDLQGYDAIGAGGELEPLVWAFASASANAIYDIDPSLDAVKRKWAAYVVVREIQEIIRLFPQNPKIFVGRLRRVATLIKAAATLAMYHGPPEAPGASSLPSPPGSFFARDQYGQQILVICGTQSFVFRCEPDSAIARCAQELWLEKDPTKPYRVPTRRELRKHLCCDEATVTKKCRAEGFPWLPRAPAGRPRRRWRHRPRVTGGKHSSAPTWALGRTDWGSMS